MPCWEDGLTFTMHPNSTHLPIASYLPSTLASSLPKEKKRKLSPWNCSVSQGATQYILLSTQLYLQILSTESLVWFEASGFYYTVNIRSSLGLFSDIPLSWRSCSSDLQDWPLHILHIPHHRWGRCWGG